MRQFGVGGQFSSTLDFLQPFGRLMINELLVHVLYFHVAPCACLTAPTPANLDVGLLD